MDDGNTKINNNNLKEKHKLYELMNNLITYKANDRRKTKFTQILIFYKTLIKYYV